MAEERESQQEWTVRSMLEWTQGYLERKGDEHPRLSAEWLINSALGLSRVEIYMSFDRRLTSEELSAMHEAVVRRGRGEPLQYVTGEMPFRHIVLHCERGVLIPRPETEVLVDAALEGVDAARAAGHGAHVLEVGVGTGCISCSIASERPGTSVVATDISPQAVRLARRNCGALGVASSVHLVECDLAAGVDESTMGAFDVLVSNPPYIPSSVVPTLPAEVVGFEPGLALDGGADGLDVFRRILDVAPRALRPGGMLCCELFETNVHVAAELCRAQGGWASVEVRDDLTHRPRVLVALRAGSLAEGGELASAPRVLRVDQAAPSADVLREAVRVLRSGGVLVMPTDSVYGIGCAAFAGCAGHGRIFDIKERSHSQTLPLLVADPPDLATYGTDVPVWGHRLAEELWPGALTLVVRASTAVPAEYVRPDGTIALRCPDSPLVRGLAREVGAPLATTSANIHGAPAATSAGEVGERLLRLADLTLDAGTAPLARASTIVDCTGEAPSVVREGAIAAQRILDIALN